MYCSKIMVKKLTQCYGTHEGKLLRDYVNEMLHGQKW